MLLPFGQFAADGRLLVNLITVHALVLLLLGLSVALRWLVTHSTNRLGRLTNSERLKQFSAEATRHGHTMLFWLTVTAMALTVIGGIVYQLLGRDALDDLNYWFNQLTPAHFLRVGTAVGGLAVLVIFTVGLLRVLRRLLPVLENYAFGKLGHPQNEATLRRWFHLLEAFVILAAQLAAVWIGCQLLGVGAWADDVFGFLLRVLSIAAVARLLTLASRATTQVLAENGTKHLGQTSFNRYWERIARLFPFGEQCFDAAVYVTAASLIVEEFHFILKIIGPHIGPHIVECIGIFFCTRVLIELLQVLLNEAFGMYKEDNQFDQKGRTLVPLLYSMCQYVLYFGSFVMMLHALEVNIMPLLAGAGILGLGIGLGAQSLVTDVVSGFFILFETQYLVGDYVQVGDAAGTVEEISLRVTKIRDGKGKLHIIPNGQIKGVISYSKGYVNAVVEVKMPAGSDLESLFRAMKEAGRRLKAEHREVLANTEIHGLVDWGPSDMTIRAVTKVQPGTHGVMQSEYRRMLKQVLDEKQAPALQTAAAA
jgi:moderate conductance mechanosensitive channel